MAARGLFVTFEGIDGSGKTTLLRRLAARLRAMHEPERVKRIDGAAAPDDVERAIWEVVRAYV